MLTFHVPAPRSGLRISETVVAKPLARPSDAHLRSTTMAR